MAGKPGRSGKVHTSLAHARRMAAAAKGGATTRAKKIAASIGGGTHAESASWIQERQRAEAKAAVTRARLAELDLERRLKGDVPDAEVEAQLGRIAGGIRRILRVGPSLVDELGLPPDQATAVKTVIGKVCAQIRILIAREVAATDDEVSP